MAELPIEQVTQRHPRGIVAAPGVVLWATETTYAFPRGYVENVDEVEPGEVALAQMASPEFFWNIETTMEPHVNTPGVYQSYEFGDFAFGVGEFGGIELAWDEERPRYSYTIGSGDGF